MQLIRSEARRGQSTGSELERACAEMIRADLRPSPQAAQGAGVTTPSVTAPQPRIGRAAPTPGPEAPAAFNPSAPGVSAPSATASQPAFAGATSGPTVTSENLLNTDVLGALTGDGINAELSHVYEDQLSLIGRARYSRTNASGQSATNIGIAAGFDYFVMGGDNQGLRVGPRLEGSFGNLSAPGTTNGYGRLSLLGEVGYNLVAANGLSGVLAGGFDLRMAGAQGTDVGFNSTGNFSPYLRLGVGYSW